MSSKLQKLRELREEINLKIDTITEDIFLEEENDEVKEEVIKEK